jgi:hypothetical protein
VSFSIATFAPPSKHNRPEFPARPAAACSPNTANLNPEEIVANRAGMFHNFGEDF